MANSGISEEKIKYIQKTFSEDYLKQMNDTRLFFYYHMDLFFDALNTETNFKLHAFQRMILRDMSLHRYSFVLGSRGLSKSFLSGLYSIGVCLLLPGCRRLITAPGKGQVDEITGQVFDSIIKFYPFLKNEIKLNENGEIITVKNQYGNILFKNGSVIHINYSKAKGRGNRANGGIVEESGHSDFDRDNFESEIAPNWSNPRVLMSDKQDSIEWNGQMIEITNAHAVNTLGHKKMNDYIQYISNGLKDYTFIAMDFRVPCMFGMTNIDEYLRQKYSRSVTEESFLRNWHSEWTGVQAGQLIDKSVLNNLFNLPYPILKSEMDDWRYVLSIDVADATSAEKSADTVMVVLRFRYNINSQDYQIEIVNIETYVRMNYDAMARKIKESSMLYNPEVVCIDANGVGQSLISPLMRDNYDGLGCFGIMFESLFKDLNKESYLNRVQVLRDSESPNANKILFPLRSTYSVTREADMNIALKEALVNRKIRFINYEKDSMRLTSNVMKHFDVPSADDWKATKIQDIYLEFQGLNEEFENTRMTEKGQLQLEKKTQQKDRFSAVKYGLAIVNQLILNSSYKPQSNVSYKNMAVKKNSSQSKGMTPEQKYIQELTGRKNGKRSSKSRRSIGAKIR